MLPFKYKPSAENDIFKQIIYLYENASVEIAERFQLRVRETVDLICEFSKVGVKAQDKYGIEGHENLRCFSVKDFEDFQIFYEVQEFEVVVYRVLSSVRDIINFSFD